MVLLVVHGSTPEVIAEIEGCTVNTVYWRIHKAAGWHSRFNLCATGLPVLSCE